MMASTHGMSAHPLYLTWLTMMHRCYNPKRRDYHNYGGRGIRVCKRWHSVTNFIADMGERPDGHTLERRDTNSNYSKRSCVWATQKEQQRNRRNNHLVTWRGDTHCLKEWSEILGIPYVCLHLRVVQYGWSIDRAFTQPVQVKRKR